MSTTTTSKPTKPRDAYLAIEFSPSWSFISQVRRFCDEFCMAAGIPDDRSCKVGIASHELLQNAVSYSEDGWARIRIDINNDGGEIAVTVTSRSKEEKIARL